MARKTASAVILALVLTTLVPSTEAQATVPTGWGVSYANPGVAFQATDLTTATMVTENFDSTSRYGSNTVNAVSGTITIPGIGNLSGTGNAIRNDYTWGGAGGAGGFMTAGNLTLTLTDTQRYIGFWWSAGNSDNNVELFDGSTSLGTFTAGDLVAILGACPATPVNTDYCGNPNYSGALTNDPAKNEQFAYIHIRYAAGFNKIQFRGTGFEFDNVSISQTVPENSSTETAVTTSTVRTDCSSITSTSASSTLTACPRTIYIRKDQSFTYNPLSDSQISGYSYPNDVSVFNSYIFNGTGTQSRSGNQLTLQSSTVGTYRVDFTIARGAARDTSRITIIVVELNPLTPDVLLVDPRKTNLSLPSLNLQSSNNVSNGYICAKFVTSAVNETALSNTNSLITGISLTNSGSGVTSSGVSNEWFYTGTIANLQASTSSISLSRSTQQLIATSDSIFLQLSFLPTTNFGTMACGQGYKRTIELRKLILTGAVSQTIEIEN